MTTRTFLRIIFTLSVAALPCADPLHSQDASGIKVANLQGADLELMNNHDPVSELENFELLPGYQVNLFASDPMLANPVHMHWDSRGRLWVACSWAYPQLKPGEVANDKIIILEDTDGDGSADKSTVFADGLYLPTGIELAAGGCFVAQSPDVFFLKDTDGDDVADVKELALTGFGIEDSHHSISAWRRGPGGWLYFQEGIFLHTQVETQYGVVRNFNGGVYQFNPRTRQLKMFCRGTGGNPWGHVFDRWGQSFMVNNPRIMYLSPATGNSGEAVRIKPLISTEKQCGGDLATGTHVGDDIRGQLLTGRFKSRTVVRYELHDEGAGFSANVLSPLISSKHPNFRPVDVKMGPDGAVYVADWYNSIINHAQHDFRDPRRDHDHGRIWRITHKDRPLAQKPQLETASLDSLVQYLSSPEAWVRHAARKELSQRDADQVLTAAEAWVVELSRSLPEYDHHLVEAMWACQNVGRVSEDILSRVLAADDGHARSAGARILRYWHDQLPSPVDLIAQAASDPFPRTRMEAVLSAGFIPSPDAFVAALNVLDHPADEHIDQALKQTSKALEQYWRPAFESGSLQFTQPSHREFVRQGMGLGFEQRLAEFLKESSHESQAVAAMMGQLERSATETEIEMVVRALIAPTPLQSNDTVIALLESLGRLSKSRWPRTIKPTIRQLQQLVSHSDARVARLAADNLGAWQVASAQELGPLRSSDYPVAVRQALAVALAKTSHKRYRPQLAELASNGDMATRYAAVAGLAHIDLESAVGAAGELLAESPDAVDPTLLIKTILKQKDGGQLLAHALQGVEVHPSVRSMVEAFHRKSGFLPEVLARQFHSGTQSSLTAKLLAEELADLTADVEAHGNPARGESIYRRPRLACMQCHAIGPVGPEIGPNLVAVGAAAKTQYIVQSILTPDAAIAEHYETRKFLLSSGEVQTGIVAFRNETQVIVRDSAELGKEIRLAVEEIEAEGPAPSLMPSGLADQLKSRDEFLDLAKFVSVLGKPGAYANDESPVIRKWQVTLAGGGVLPEVSRSATFYCKVNGELPIDELPRADQVTLDGFFDVIAPGQLRLRFNSVSGLTVSLNGKPIEDLAEAIPLQVGRHTLTVRIDTHQRSGGMRVELQAADSSARFRPVGGI